MTAMQRLITAVSGVHGAVWTTFLAMLLGSPVVAQTPAGRLVVTVEGLRSDKGAIWVCLWTKDHKDFPRCINGATAVARLKVATSAPVVTFENVMAGSYAVTAIHDETGTGNGEVNLVGLPKSGVGLSNQPSIGLTNRPTFEKGAFRMPATTTLSIRLNYLF